jgi:TonB family protein
VISIIRLFTLFLVASAGIVAGAEGSLTAPPIDQKTQWFLYPAHALGMNQQGRVLIEFAISPAGSPVDAKVVTSEPKGSFDRDTMRDFRALRFVVPSDWESSGRSRSRLRLSVVFALKPRLDRPTYVAPTPYEADYQITVSTQAIPQAH